MCIYYTFIHMYLFFEICVWRPPLVNFVKTLRDVRIPYSVSKESPKRINLSEGTKTTRMARSNASLPRARPWLKIWLIICESDKVISYLHNLGCVRGRKRRARKDTHVC